MSNTFFQWAKNSPLGPRLPCTPPSYGPGRSCVHYWNNFFSFISPYKATFDCLYKLLLTAVTLPVTSASCEKRFSKIKLVKTFPRNSMTSERLSSIALLPIERVWADNIYLDNFIDKLDSRHDRIKLYWVVVDTKFWRRLCRVCVSQIAICLFFWNFF